MKADRKRHSAARVDVPASGAASNADPQPDGHTQKIAEAAYFRAAQRGFAPGHEVDDWLEAEKEVAHLLLSIAA